MNHLTRRRVVYQCTNKVVLSTLNRCPTRGTDAYYCSSLKFLESQQRCTVDSIPRLQKSTVRKLNPVLTPGNCIVCTPFSLSFYSSRELELMSAVTKPRVTRKESPFLSPVDAHLVAIHGRCSELLNGNRLALLLIDSWSIG